MHDNLGQSWRLFDQTPGRINGKEKSFSKILKSFLPIACLLQWPLPDDGLSLHAAASLDAGLQTGKLLPSGDLWGEVGGRVDFFKILRNIGLVSHLNGTDGNIRTHGG